MATIPSAAAQIQQPPDPMAQVAKGLELKGMLFGLQGQQADLQKLNLSNQELQMQLDGMHRLRAAQNDPEWNPNDTDAALKVMQHYQVPLDVSGKVISAIGQIRLGLQQQSSDNISNTKAAHDFFDDQLQSVKSAPLDSKQSTYESAIQNVRNYVNLLPDGMAKKQFLTEVGSVPPIYDALWVDRQHSQLRTLSQLTEEALKQAQTRDAAGKGRQAESEAAINEGKITPGSPAYAPTPQALALGKSQGDPWATAIQSGEAQQAGAVEGAKASAQFPYQQQLESIRQQVSQTQQINKDAADKIEGTVLKPYEDKMSQVGELQSAIAQAAKGNVTAARGVLLKLIGVTNPDGTKRYNEAEATRLLQQGSIPQRVAGSVKNLLTGDQWTDQMKNDMMDFASAQAGVAKSNLNRGIGNVNRLYGTKVGTGLQESDTVTMKAPNGQTKEVPVDQVDHYKGMGATVVDKTGPPAPGFSSRGNQ